MTAAPLPARPGKGSNRLDGGELTIVDDAADPAQGRPTDFTTAKGSGRVLLVFAR